MALCIKTWSYLQEWAEIDVSDELLILAVPFYKQTQSLKMPFCSSNTTMLLTTHSGWGWEVPITNETTGVYFRWQTKPEYTNICCPGRGEGRTTWCRRGTASRQSTIRRPTDPQNLRDLALDNHCGPKQSVKINTTNFLHYDNGPDADELVIVFDYQTTPPLPSTLYNTWSMDGTFSAPRLFSQLYIIQAKSSIQAKEVKGVFQPLAYALQRKTRTTYTKHCHVYLKKQNVIHASQL